MLRARLRSPHIRKLQLAQPRRQQRFARHLNVRLLERPERIEQPVSIRRIILPRSGRFDRLQLPGREHLREDIDVLVECSKGGGRICAPLIHAGDVDADLREGRERRSRGVRGGGEETLFLLGGSGAGRGGAGEGDEGGLVADVEFERGEGGCARVVCGGDEAGAFVRGGGAADDDFGPGDAAGAVDEEVFEEVGGQRHLAVFLVVEARYGFLLGGLEGVEEGEGWVVCEIAHVHVPSC